MGAMTTGTARDDTGRERERCEACGFDGGCYDDAELLAELRALAGRWAALLDGVGEAELRARPAPEVWSAIEYLAHSRDITGLHAFGVEASLTGEEPDFGDIGDELVEGSAASDDDVVADPAALIAELDAHAGRLADLAAAAEPQAWTLGLTIGGERSDVRRLLEHALHDSVHHLDDVERGLAS